MISVVSCQPASFCWGIVCWTTCSDYYSPPKKNVPSMPSKIGYVPAQPDKSYSINTLLDSKSKVIFFIIYSDKANWIYGLGLEHIISCCCSPSLCTELVRSSSGRLVLIGSWCSWRNIFILARSQQLCGSLWCCSPISLYSTASERACAVAAGWTTPTLSWPIRSAPCWVSAVASWLWLAILLVKDNM